MLPLDIKDIEDAVDYSNFSQRVKLAYWEKTKGKLHLVEHDIEEILLLAWEDFKEKGGK